MMRTSRWTLAAVVVAVIAIALPALSVAGPNTVRVSAKLKGSNEVPESGDPNGKGDVTVRLKARKRKVCFNLEISKLEGASAGHIHKGGEDVAGPIKVTLFDEDPPLAGTGTYQGCVKKVRKKLVRRIGRHPEKFYVNVHNAEYPDGAIRGQLEPGA